MGGGFFHSKGTWGCAALEGILFRTSSLAKGILFCNFGLAKGIIFDNGAVMLSALAALESRNFVLPIFKETDKRKKSTFEIFALRPTISCVFV